MGSRYQVRLRFALVAAFLFQTASAAQESQQQGDNWRRYTANGEEWSAMFPELPSVTTYDNFQRGDTGRKERVIAAFTDGVVLAIYSFETRDRNQSLKQFIKEMVNSYLPGDGARFVREISVTGVNGVEAALTGEGVIGTVQFYKTDKHSYAIAAVGVGRSHPTAERFFASLQFDSKPAGEQLKDGPGQDIANSADPPLNRRDVSKKPIIVTKPQAAFTSLAEKNATNGVVVLRVVFSATGRVIQIQTVKSLSNGLTENAIVAARRIRFIPATKDGKFVSMWMQLEYYFWR